MSKEEKTKKERSKEQIQLYEIMAGMFFAGAFIFAINYFNQGNRYPALKIIFDIALGGFAAVGIGLFGRKIFQTATEDNPSQIVFRFVVFVLASVFLFTVVANYTSDRNGDSVRCSSCEIRIGSESSVDFGADHICTDCFAEKLTSGELGYCERCCEAFEISDMKAGLCIDCFEAFVQFHAA